MDNYLEMRRHIFPNANVTSHQQCCSSSVRIPRVGAQNSLLAIPVVFPMRVCSHAKQIHHTRSNLSKKA